MDLTRLESAIRRMVGEGTDRALRALRDDVAVGGELALAAGTLSEREGLWPTAPDDVNRPWA